MSRRSGWAIIGLGKIANGFMDGLRRVPDAFLAAGPEEAAGPT